MRVITAAEMEAALDFRGLIEALRTGFRGDFVTPLRQHLTIARPDRPDSMLLIMPSWTDFEAQGHSERGYTGVKLVTVTPDNAQFGKASVIGVYMLFSGITGEPVAVIDGRVLTLWRTAAMSALAATYLARSDARRLLMVGAGSLAPYLIEAHSAIRPINEVLIWNRTPEKAAAIAKRLNRSNRGVSATDDLEEAVRGADIISCATMSKEPLVQGNWLPTGAHLDLVGGFTPEMREADDRAVRLSRVFVDTRDGALAEAGDIIQPIDNGVLTADHLQGDLFALTRGDVAGRRSYTERTLFKSTGNAVADQAAAVHVLMRV